MTHEAVGEPEARRALVLHDRSIVIDLIQLTLNHGLFVVRHLSSGIRDPSAHRSHYQAGRD